MNHFLSAKFKTMSLSLVIALTSVLAMAQGQQLEEKLMVLKQNQATNKQKLSQYTWQETETISVKGSVKDTKVYQVQMGPDGKPQKTEISNQQAQQSGRDGRLKKRAVEHVTDEYQQYGQSIGALAKQ